MEGLFPSSNSYRFFLKKMGLMTDAKYFSKYIVEWEE